MVHQTKAVWIRHYPLDPRGESWQAYRSLHKPKKGQSPWAVDNKRIGSESGFRSYAEAEKAALSYIESNEVPDLIQ